MAQPMKAPEVTAKTAASGRSTLGLAVPVGQSSDPRGDDREQDRAGGGHDSGSAVPAGDRDDQHHLSDAQHAHRHPADDAGNRELQRAWSSEDLGVPAEAGTGLLGLRYSCHVQHARRGPDYR